MNDSTLAEKEPPQLGVDARLTRTFDDDPLIKAIRAENQAIILATQVRKHPDQYRNDPRAVQYLAQLAINAALKTGPTFGTGGSHHQESELNHGDETAHPGG
jgi:hypothetical protein